MGIALGTYLALTLSKIFVLLRDTAATLTLFERFEVALIGLLAGTGICLGGALLPILKAKRADPLTALKEI